MQSDVWMFLKGYAKVEIRGGHLEMLLNDAVQAGLNLRDIRRTSPDTATVVADLPAFFALPPLLKRRGCKLHVMARGGFPFLLKRATGRMVFAAGLLGFVFGLWLLGQMVWSIDVTGNEQISESLVLEAAREAGIRPLQWKFRLDEPRELSRKLVRALPGAAWVGVELRGTGVLIRIAEQTMPERRKPASPRHLVSGYDAVVTQLIAERGKPAVNTHDRVRRGDVLISGLIGTEERQDAVVAEGVVRGLVWHEFEIASPLVHKYRVYSGESKTRRYVTFGKRALQISGFGEPSFAAHESVVEHRVLAWRNWKLPVGYIREVLLEAGTEEEQVPPESAREIGLTQARGELLQRAGKDAVIRDEKILHEKIEGGKVYMKVLFEVEQDIARERSIIRGD